MNVKNVLISQDMHYNLFPDISKMFVTQYVLKFAILSYTLCPARIRLCPMVLFFSLTYFVVFFS